MKQMPPKNIEPIDLFEQIIAMPRAHRRVEAVINGQKVPMIIWVMKGVETQLCTIEAEKFVRRMLKEHDGEVPKNNEKSEGYKDLYDSRASVEILSRVCRKADDINKPFFMTPDQISKHLSTDEIAVLVRKYIIIQREVGPIVSEMDRSEMDAWIEVITEGGSLNFLAGSTSDAQMQLLKYMADQLSSLRMGTSSSTRLPDENSSEDMANEEQNDA